MAAYIRFSTTPRRSLMPAICSSSSFWVAASTPRRAAASARSTASAASCGLDRGQARRLGQRIAPVLELRDGGVEVLHRQQVLQVVGHVIAS